METLSFVQTERTMFDDALSEIKCFTVSDNEPTLPVPKAPKLRPMRNPPRSKFSMPLPVS